MSSLKSLRILKPIKKLDERVVIRISAGEVIHRPVNVVKELIENCLDANSTSIEVTVKDGGIKSIEVKDNGCGIRKEDLDIVCERFTTSKLEVFEDLLQIQTYGFRGEALSAISHISYVTILTKTEEQICGFRLEFIDGKPKSKAVSMALNTGTTITVENLFYNLLMRKKALNSVSNEYNLILDVITKYSIHNSNRVSFSLKKSGFDCDLNTNIGIKTIDNIRQLYGTNIANNLIELSFEDQIKLNFSMTGFVSNQSIHQKNFVFILFINDRLVDCLSLKKAIDLVYSNYLMKGMHPFVYLSLKIQSKNIDVNIHPTKSEVHFLHEQEICEQIVNLIESKLTNNSERGLNPNQTLMNSSFSQLNYQIMSSNDSKTETKETNEKPRKDSTPLTTSKRPHKQIRTDSKDRRINEFLLSSKPKNLKRRDIQLKSVLSLRQYISEQTDSHLQDMILNSTYVGCTDETYILFQFETQLLLVNGFHLNRELFYQLFLLDFGNFSRIKFSKPLLIRDLLIQYLQHFNQSQDQSSQTSQTSETLEITQIETILMENREMISDYFSIDITVDKELISLPVLLKGFVPNFAFLPKLLYCLAKDVNWKSEKQCFESLGKVLADFYAKPPNKFESESDHQKWSKIMETIVYPTYKAVLCPSKALINDFFVTTKTSDLYKVFERC